MDKKIVDVSSEILDILQRVQGVSGVSEDVLLTYVVVVKSDEHKEGAEAIGHTLIAQANKFNINLDIGVYTEAEVKEAQDKLIELNNKNTSFKS